MNTALIHRAGENITGQPVSVEPDGTAWTGTFDDQTSVDPEALAAEVARLEAEEAQTVADRVAGLRKLAEASGLSEAEITALIG